MAYISGTIGTFQSRLHSLPTGLVDITGSSNNFWKEGQSYKSLIPTGLQYSWSKEYGAKYYELTHTGIKLTLNYFG